MIINGLIVLVDERGGLLRGRQRQVKTYNRGCVECTPFLSIKIYLLNSVVLKLQRVAIVRALLKNAPILILDEVICYIAF
jgi:ABC-type multidrug transport system fused ATPase/permease subunit